MTERIYQGLSDIQVAIEDTSSNSPEYFRITQLDTEFTSGPNTIQFKGNPKYFVEGSPVYVEILDSRGYPINYNIEINLDTGEAIAIISVDITNDIPTGVGLITLCGTISKSASGTVLDTSKINVRWTKEIYIDAGKLNNSDILFSSLPEVSIVNSTGSYINYLYPTGRFISESITNLQYLSRNDQAVIYTSSLSNIGFDNTSPLGYLLVNYSDLASLDPTPTNVDTTSTYTSSIYAYNGNGIAFLTDAIRFPFTNASSTTLYQPKSAVITNALLIMQQSASLGFSETENRHNLAVATFYNLAPIAGTIAKIRSYYRSSGIGEYIFVNETNIQNLTTFGNTLNYVTTSFYIPTVQRNDRLDFKFEFVNPKGITSKQYIESLNNLFIGGNTYIGGNDNLLTGSLFVAGQTGTGVEITGKGNASVVKSIGYQGLQKAQAGTAPAGFVLYSGSIQPVINSTETYNGVGLDLVANTSSYFRYTTDNGGLLDIHTDKFFIGNANTFLSGSNNNLEILVKDPVPPLTKFHLRPSGEVTASAFIAFTGSSDTNNFLQVNTKIGLIDGKNIGRQIYTQTSPISVSGYDTSTIPGSNQLTTGKVIDALTGSLTWSSISSDIPFYALPYENRITVMGNLLVEKATGAVGDHDYCLFLRFGLTYIQTSSFANFGTNTGIVYGNSGSVDGTGTSLNNSQNFVYTFGILDGSGTVKRHIPFKSVITINTEFSDKLALMNLDYAHVKLNSATAGPTFTLNMAIANIIVNTSRQLPIETLTGNGGNGYLPSAGPTDPIP